MRRGPLAFLTMADGLFPELTLLSPTERSCLSRYLRLLTETLREDLISVIVFGSVARAESWPQGMPIRSDLDLLVVTHSRVTEGTAQQLLDATLPLYLEAGRQISPQFRTTDQLHANDERAVTFREHIARDGVAIFTS